jgi:hypothetical protein
MFNTAGLIQKIEDDKQRHEMACAEVKSRILLTEQKLEELNDVYQRHMGAQQACIDTLGNIQALIRGATSSPFEAVQESDQ